MADLIGRNFYTIRDVKRIKFKMYWFGKKLSRDRTWSQKNSQGTSEPLIGQK